MSVKKIFCIIFCLLFNSNFAFSLSLNEVLINTYNYNQLLNSERQTAKQGNEAKLNSITNFLPKLNAKYDTAKGEISSSVTKKYSTQSLAIQQPIFRSGGSLLTYKKALKQKAAADARLAGAEQKILLSSIKVYMDVLYQEQITKLSKKNAEILAEYLVSAEGKKKFGEATNTDVAQAQSRLASAQTEYLSNIGLYEAAKAKFENITGLKPENLEIPSKENYSETFDLEKLKSQALLFNKNLIESKNNLEAANYEIKRKMTDLLPNLNINYNVTESTNQLLSPSSRSVGLEWNIPIFQNGSEYVQFKSAKRQYNSLRFNHQDTINSVLEKTITLWHDHQIAISKISSTKTAEKAGKIAADGVRQETEMGVKTIVELLDAEKDLFNAQINALKAWFDLVLSYYSIKFQIGELSLEKLIVTEYN